MGDFYRQSISRRWRRQPPPFVPVKSTSWIHTRCRFAEVAMIRQLLTMEYAPPNTLDGIFSVKALRWPIEHRRCCVTDAEPSAAHNADQPRRRKWHCRELLGAARQQQVTVVCAGRRCQLRRWQQRHAGSREYSQNHDNITAARRPLVPGRNWGTFSLRHYWFICRRGSYSLAAR